ncbi:hypothetical protein AAF712_010969 [Marasmius tenuissimus]|uniref:Uncharacterized protein n=1 Tax=Marasmius tenuissimus TaxID=585030 RepID=A0ABR2ZL96_9AGAR
MAPGKRRRIGVESFLDIAAAEDRDAYDEGESEVEEEHFELSDDDDIDPPAAQTTLSFEAPKDRQSFVDALCADLTSRYVKPHLISEASNMQQPVTTRPCRVSTLELATDTRTLQTNSLPSSSNSLVFAISATHAAAYIILVDHRPISAKESRKRRNLKATLKTPSDIPQVNKIDPWERAHTLGKNADRANLPSVHRDDLRREKETLFSRVCSGPYRGDVGLAIGLEKDEIDVREDEQLEEITNNKLKYRPAEKRRRDQAREWEQLRAEQRKWVKAISHEAELEPDLQWLEDSSIEQLLLATSIPPKLEDLFRQTNHPDLELAPFPHPSNWSFDEGEEVISAGVNATFKYLQANARSNRQQLAVVHLRVQLAPKPTNNPYVLYPRPADETLEE